VKATEKELNDEPAQAGAKVYVREIPIAEELQGWQKS
jgi:hypothetical protein